MNAIFFAFAMLAFYIMLAVGFLAFLSFWYITVPLASAYLLIKYYSNIKEFLAENKQIKQKKIDTENLSYSDIKF